MEYLEQEPRFSIFLQALEHNNDIVIRDSLYEGIFKEYIEYLNRDTVWDIELIKKGLSNTKLENKRILDLGCGDGRITRQLSELSELVVGIDISEEQISKAKLLNQDNAIEWICGDMMDNHLIKQIANKYDINVVVSSAASVNCFLSKKELRKLFSNIYQSFSQAVILLPVFDQNAKPFFETNFKGGLGIEYFDYKSNKLQTLFGMKFITEKGILLQPTLISVPLNNSNIQYEFCLSIERIWDNKEVTLIAQECGWYLRKAIDDNVLGGGADNFNFQLLELRSVN